MNKTESKEIQNSLIKSYEILEEKFNNTNDKINDLKAELNEGHQEKEKREK